MIRELNTIIHRDSKDTTYKFALLRGVIESIHKYNHYNIKEGDWVRLPIGILVFKWIEYYYPILSSDKFVPQRHGDNPCLSLAFRKEFNPITSYYRNSLGLPLMLRQLQTGKVPDDIAPQLLELIRKIRQTIIKNPMTYIGGSIGKQGELFVYKKDAKTRSITSNTLDILHVIEYCGTYMIPVKLFDTLKILGSFITGQDALLFQWADFTTKASSNFPIVWSEAIELIQPKGDYKRDVGEMQLFYKQIQEQGDLYCVWTGKPIKNDLNVDHVIPFVLWRNNDLWNLMPSKKIYNSQKNDKIPTLDLLLKQKHLIIDYWKKIYNRYPQRFINETSLSLTGLQYTDEANLFENCFNSLLIKCNFLISKQGYETWQPKNVPQKSCDPFIDQSASNIFYS